MSVYNSFSDRELISLLPTGDTDAFEEIYERYHSLLYIYAYKKLNHKQEAQDIVQEVLINLWDKRFNFSLQSSLASYLFTATRNRALDLFAHRKVETRYLASLQAFIDDAGLSTDNLIRERDIQSLIEKEIQALPPRMYEVFRLSRQMHLTHKEIARQMNISEQTVATQIKKALKHLRTRLGIITWMILFLNI